MNERLPAHVLAAVERAVPNGVRTRATDRLGFAHDASHYVLVPQAVVTPRNADEVASLLRVGAETGVSLTFRSGGTSLSGQGVCDALMVDTRRHFRDVEVLDSGERVRVRPGATVRAVNNRLKPFGRKLGPDPASEIACTVGGVVANNSSGMSCGIEANTYRTLESAVLVLASGTVLDTAAPDADERLRATEPHVHEGLARLRDRVRDDLRSVDRIRRLFSIKNTMGYGVNAFLDHTRPVDLLLRLVIGSEGTLAFVAEATFRTVASDPHASTALLVFRDLATATTSLPELVAEGLTAIELLDASSLRVAQHDPRAPAPLRTIDVDGHAALLVEHQAHTREAVLDRAASTASLVRGMSLVTEAGFSTDAAARASYWSIRKGLYAAVAGARPSGTTALLEDVAVPVQHLLPLCRSLQGLFDQHRYDSSVIFGHAKDGNLHFLINESFDDDARLQRYVDFTEDLAELVLGHDGTLKAEHGTGRMMAPFVRRQYGDELYEVMTAIKQLLDPKGILNPGVILDDDDRAHVKHLKTTPTVEPEVDRCVECGYCEPVCPSGDLTTTPRRRIVLRRELEAARIRGDHRTAKELEEDYSYDAVETCAVDGMCRTTCPVSIDTGDLMRRLRREQGGRIPRRAWTLAAGHWDGITRAAATGLTTAGALPPQVAERLTAAARTVASHDAVPAWSRDLPGGGDRRLPRVSGRPKAVYFPACISTIFGRADGGQGVRDAFVALCERAGVGLLVPDEIASLCCGTPWKSKGMDEGYDAMRAAVVDALRRVETSATIPVVVDAASCTEGLMRMVESADLDVQVVDAVSFVDAVVLPSLPPARRLPSLVLHHTCSSEQLELDDAVRRVAAAAADQVVEPDDWGCCAFAGDRGLLHPELTASATAREAAAVRRTDATAHASLNRTCEVGMSRATGAVYRHLLEVLEHATREPTPP